MKRTFIAINLSVNSAIQEFLEKIKYDLKDEKIRWVDDANFHITLFFVGDTLQEMISRISKELKLRLDCHSQFELICKGFGIFRNLKSTRALWLGFEKSELLLGLKHTVDEVMKELGLEFDQNSFSPHLTIGRTKFIKNKNQLNELLNFYGDQQFQNFTISDVIFYESILRSEGPIYTEIEKFNLNISPF